MHEQHCSFHWFLPSLTQLLYPPFVSPPLCSSLSHPRCVHPTATMTHFHFFDLVHRSDTSPEKWQFRRKTHQAQSSLLQRVGILLFWTKWRCSWPSSSMRTPVLETYCTSFCRYCCTHISQEGKVDMQHYCYIRVLSCALCFCPRL